jgi:hypothetical protein
MSSLVTQRDATYSLGLPKQTVRRQLSVFLKKNRVLGYHWIAPQNAQPYWNPK